MQDQNAVFIPGPTNLPDQIRAAVDIQTRDHRSPDFPDFFGRLRKDLRRVFGTTDGEVLIFPSSGTGGWEAAITNTLSEGDKVLVASYGLFSDKWIALCRDLGLQPTVINCEWGDPAPVERFREILATDSAGEFKALLVTHNETATGVRSDIAAVRNILDDTAHAAMLFVDCVSSLASMPFDMDAWGVDVAVCGSQKGFMLPAGMSILGVSQKALRAAGDATCRRSYFDFNTMLEASRQGSYPYTPPVQLLSGLRASVDLLLQEGLENVYKRHTRIAEGVRRAVEAWGLQLVAKDPAHWSDTVSAIWLPKGYDAGQLVDHAYRQYGMSFGAGLGQLAGKVFRIGHLGQVTEAMALSGIAVIEMAMCDIGVPVEMGRGVRAAQQAYRLEVRPVTGKVAEKVA